ncbi:Sec8 exocyst complex component-specific domain-containing protein [Fimicolochytrium jonesii]|uniref:Sec8 exocyst complex component-specific domain-containing protein n=1 Tax=Fimicolochytrium jonesii TaxID=1396493 RepID=UPI0022FF0B3C|nr:Sec8 exocyst complex component-specific domain-containing protein [Fimicolochytrium jonesii]KAI8818997.1 Sec8 exocyst complex component-specific domain-containing protein [Fimicolochytrium jonesii]
MFTGASRSPRRPEARSTRQESVEHRDFGDGPEPNTLPKVVNEVQSEINISWDFMTSSEFNPVPHALSLLDESSLGRDYVAFCAIYDKLEMAMDVVVNDYHQAFNTAIQTFSNVVENITDSQRRVRDSRKRLENSKEWLQCKRFDLLHLWLKSLQYKEIARILDMVEDLQTMPARLEALIQGKYYLTAVRLLQSATRSIEEGECAEIGALEAVAQKLHEIRTSIHETLIEELHSHIYLKSAFSLYRLDAVDQSELHNENHWTDPSQKSNRERPGKTGDEAWQSKLRRDSDAWEPEITEDLEANPEADSFQFILCIMEALFLLGRVREAMELIRDRLPIELYYVVERTVQEADHNVTIPLSKNDEPPDRVLASRPPNLLGTTTRAVDAQTLLQFLWQLFRKFESIIQAHLFVQAILADFAGRQTDEHLEGLYSSRDVWYSAQNELKALIYEYVSSSERKGSEPNAAVTLNDMLKDKRRAKIRTDSQPLFKVVGTDASEMLTTYKSINPDAERALAQDVLKVRVNSTPLDTRSGSDDEAEGEGDGEGTTAGIVDTYAANAVVTGHRLLISADPYNILVVFGPTFGFVRRMETGLGVKFSNLRVFLEEFVLSVFLPQMENRVLRYFNTYVNGIDAFHAESAPETSPYPLAKSTLALTVLIRGITRAVPHIPIHQSEAVQMIDVVLRSYYEKCLARFKALTSSNQPGADGGYSSIVSAAWVQDDEIFELLSERAVYHDDATDAGSDFTTKLAHRETFAELALKKDRSFHRSELLLEHRTLKNLGSLHHSIEWFVEQTTHLLSVPPDRPSTARHSGLRLMAGAQSSNESLASFFQLSSDSLPELPVGRGEEVPIALAEEMVERFKALLTNFRRLSDLCLFVLRVELRCHSMFFLDLAMREGTYDLDDDTQDPDPYIGILNTDLSTLEEVLSGVMGPKRTRFIFSGLPHLISATLTAALPHIKKPTVPHGTRKLVRNVCALQQNLTNIASVHDVGLERAKDYFALLELPGEELIKQLGDPHLKGRFTYEECRVVLDLIFADARDDVARARWEECGRALREWFTKH